jgi:L-threonylcarbamoyladenylate synthase
MLRPGGVGLERLRALFDQAGMPDTEIRLAGHPASGAAPMPAAPGTRYRHYSPRAAVRLFAAPDELAALLADPAVDPPRCSLIGAELMPGAAGVLAGRPAPAHVSVFGGLDDYARHLYRELVAADHRGNPVVLAWLPPALGLGLALRDRLERAAGKTG